MKETVTRLHRELIEHIAESDDALLTKFFDQGGLSEEEFRAGIHDAVQKQHFIPLFCTAAETGVGVARLMDFIAKYGPSPVDRERQPALDANDAPVEVRLADDAPVAIVFQNDGGGAFWRAVFLPRLFRRRPFRDGTVQRGPPERASASARSTFSTAASARRWTNCAAATLARW